MKLSIELVPKTSWFKNLRSLLAPEEWDKLRREIYLKANYRCEVCGGKGPKHPVECHEVWHYDDIQHRQTLIGLVALCPACHQVKHIGLAELQGKYKIALKHLMKVNKWTKRQADQHIKAAVKKWKERSEVGWQVDVSLIENDRMRRKP